LLLEAAAAQGAKNAAKATAEATEASLRVARSQGSCVRVPAADAPSGRISETTEATDAAADATDTAADATTDAADTTADATADAAADATANAADTTADTAADATDATADAANTTADATNTTADAAAAANATATRRTRWQNTVGKTWLQRAVVQGADVVVVGHQSYACRNSN
jgi:hypothetical protein